MTTNVSAKLRRGSVIAAAVVACLGTTVASAQGGAPTSRTAVPGDPTKQAAVAAVGSPGGLTVEPESFRAERLARPASTTCATSVDGASDCLTTLAALPATALTKAGGSTNAIPDYPLWCTSQDLQADRTRACYISFVERTMTQTRNGVPVPTGGASMVIRHYASLSTGTGVWTHWLEMDGLSAWGAGLVPPTIVATPQADGDCDVRDWYFPSGMQPLGTATGSASFVTRVTRSGTIGTCITAWVWDFQIPGYPRSNPLAGTMTRIRCDRDTAGTDTIGCVVPWAVAWAEYSMDSYPTLSLHVLAAQGSGLPGGLLGDPLIRTEDEAIINLNRKLACGDAPRFPEYSCDEYPPATSRQGLSAGGMRRTTRGGCMFPALPRNVTGPNGVSVCMILEGENHAQGGVHTQFFRRWRVLDGDPWKIRITA